MAQRLESSRELFNLNEAATRLKTIVGDLDPPPASFPRVCQRCGCYMYGLQRTIMDLDQAFEACQASRVQVAWNEVSAHVAQTAPVPNVVIRRGKRFYADVGKSKWNRGNWCLTFAMLGRALGAAAELGEQHGIGGGDRVCLTTPTNADRRLLDVTTLCVSVGATAVLPAPPLTEEAIATAFELAQCTHRL